jgi:hypothetical protein
MNGSAPRSCPRPSEAELRLILAPHVTATWPLERMLALCLGWNAGEKAEALAAQLRLTKNTVLGKVHRLKAFGILEARPSPIMRDPNDPRRVTRSDERGRPPVPVSTLPPLPSAGGHR